MRPTTGIPTLSVEVTPSDSTNYSRGVALGFKVGVSGDVAIVYQDGSVCVEYCVAGIDYPRYHIRINATNTTATDIVALY
jgi:hypothetical protein